MRKHNTHFTGLYVAQEARRAGQARADDNAYASDGASRFQSAAIVDTSTPAARTSPATPLAAAQLGTLTLPWPPTGNHAVKHANGAHYLRPEVIAYRDSVADICARFQPIQGRYRLYVHMSPPDARARDMDNALKSLNDALVKCGYLPSDAMSYMRELLVTVDDERLGHVRVEARPA